MVYSGPGEDFIIREYELTKVESGTALLFMDTRRKH